MTSATLNYIVLGVAFLMEGTSWYLALREFSASKGRMRWWPAIRHSKDPANFIVLFEDSAALAGLVVAAIGVWTSHYFNDPRLDGIASIIIGIILALVANLLARERKGLLIGARAHKDVIRAVHRLVPAYPADPYVTHDTTTPPTPHTDILHEHAN